MSGDPAKQQDSQPDSKPSSHPDSQQDEKAKSSESSEPAGKAIEVTGFGAGVKIPWAWAVFVGPYMKWPTIAFSAGLFVVMVFYAISLVLKK